MSKYTLEEQCAFYALLYEFDYAVVSAISGVPVGTLRSWKQLASRKNIPLHVEVGSMPRDTFIAKYVTDSLRAQAKSAQNEYDVKKKEAMSNGGKRSDKKQEAASRKWFKEYRKRLS